MKLKIGIVLLFLATMGLQLFAQRARYKPQAHELSLQLGSLDGAFAFMGRSEYANGLPFAAQVVNGFRYTYHHSLSDGFKLSYFNRRANLQDEGNANQGTRIENQIQLGYERKYHTGPHQWAGGPEVFFNFGQTEYPIIPLSPPNPFHFQSVGAALTGSYSYFINTHLSLGLEASLYYSRPSYISGVPSPEEFPAYIFQENLTGVNASIWLNVHLVKMKKRCTCPTRR